jgi:hypothetical protein|tara:strand:+ start:128 stop:646 length:519 start_codon:yes stop_codon:yes gene_type:complete
MLLNKTADAEPSSFIVAHEMYTSDRGYRFVSMHEPKICSNLSANSLFLRSDLLDAELFPSVFLDPPPGLVPPTKSTPNAALVTSTLTFNRSCDKGSIAPNAEDALVEFGPNTAATHTVWPKLNAADPVHPPFLDRREIGYASNEAAQNRGSCGRRPSVRKPSRDTYSINSQY